MTATPSFDLDDLEDREILSLAEKVKDSWSERDEMIRAAQELRQQKWDVLVPPAWKQTARTQHSALAKEIPARVTGTLAQQPFSFSRAAPDDDETVEDASVRVTRWTQAHHQYQARHAIPGKDSWVFTLDQLINKGAVCVGSIFAPHAWAGTAPLLMDGGEFRAGLWRDADGQPTKDPEKQDDEATARAYLKEMEAYRKQARPPLSRRVPPTENCYPLFIEGRMMALFIIRKANVLEVQAGGFSVEQLGGPSYLTRSREMIEVITPNKCRYYWNKKVLEHPAWGDELITNYGFVPYTYRVGLEGGELDYGSYGTPLLNLVESNIRMIDTMLTYQFNAFHLAGFTSFYIKYDMTNGNWNLMEGDTGRKLTTFDFKTGTIMDFGPGKEVVPLTHPGLNKDFDEFLKFQIEEVARIIPRTLQGEATSSGYNTAQVSVQAKAIFYPIANAAEAIAEDVAVMDMQHISKRVPGPVYLHLEQEQGNSSKPKKVSRISLSKDDIGGYYQITAKMDRELDRITLGNFWIAMMQAGAADDQTVYEMAGGTDYQQMIARRARMQIRQSPQVMATIEERAIKRFGMIAARDEAAVRRRIVPGQDGTPMVKLADGRLAGPGQGGPQATPQQQGGIGAALGGANPQASAGAPNLNSTHNPLIASPTPQQPVRLRRRGGAKPGAPQRQGMARPSPVNDVA